MKLAVAKVAVAVTLVLVGGLALSAPAQARGHHHRHHHGITLRVAASAVAADRQTRVVRLRGHVRGKAHRVRIQQFVPRRHARHRWVRLAAARVHRHRYVVNVRLAPGPHRLRAVTGGRHSRRVRVWVSRVAAARPAARPATRPAPADACGPRLKKPGGGYWSCTFHDDFDGAQLDRTKWTPQTAFVTWSGDTHACYRDDPANVRVENGVLDLSLVKLDAPADCAVAASPTEYMSGSVSTWHQFSQQYGRFEARIKTTASNAPGLHEAFWLWPDDRYTTINWPDSGEIDVAESFSAYPSIVGSYLHYSADHVGLLYGTNAANCSAERGVWNTYAVEWGPSKIETFLNGKSCLTNTSGDIAFQKRYIINLTQAIGGASWNLLGAGTPVPASTLVDYVRVWK